VDTRGFAQEFNGDPPERKISKLDFLSGGIPFVSRWLTIATCAYRRALLSDPYYPHHLFNWSSLRYRELLEFRHRAQGVAPIITMRHFGETGPSTGSDVSRPALLDTGY
jgi:hypothetical protein